MKRIFSLAIMVLAFAAASFAQAIVAPASGPTMDFDATTIDYGTIEQGAEPLRVFRFTNNGTEPLLITNARGSCGCTVPKWPKAPIGPGESGEIEVRYDTNRLGAINKNITISSNLGEDIKLFIKGNVDKKADEPEAVPAGTGGFNGKM